jgi:hypothetical protein
MIIYKTNQTWPRGKKTQHIKLLYVLGILVLKGNGGSPMVQGGVNPSKIM